MFKRAIGLPTIVLFLFFIAILLPSCSYNAKVLSTSSPVAEIQTNKQIDCSVSYFLDADINSLNMDISPSTYVCSAHSYPLETKEALENSFEKSFWMGAFSNVEKAPDMEFSGIGHEFNFVFKLVSFNPSLEFHMGFWSATINANSEIVMKVKVYNKNGAEVLRTTIAGESSEHGKGQCGDGAHYLAKATEEAIEDLLDNFVFKVINTGDLAAKDNG